MWFQKLYPNEGGLAQPTYDCCITDCHNGNHTKPETTLAWTIFFPNRTIIRPSSALGGKTGWTTVLTGFWSGGSSGMLLFYSGLTWPTHICRTSGATEAKYVGLSEKKSIQKMVQCGNASSLLKVFACVCSNDPNPFLPTLVTAFAHAMNSHRNSCDWLGSVTQCVLPTYN